MVASAAPSARNLGSRHCGVCGSVALDCLYLNSCEKEISDHVEAPVAMTFVIATECFSEVGLQSPAAV